MCVGGGGGGGGAGGVGTGGSPQVIPHTSPKYRKHILVNLSQQYYHGVSYQVVT
jgi:hypothetical protein